MSRNGPNKTRVTEAAISGLVQYLVNNNVPEDEAIAQIHELSTDTALLSREVGHKLANIAAGHNVTVSESAVQLLIKAGGTDEQIAHAQRDIVLERMKQSPPNAPRLHRPPGVGNNSR